MRLSLAAVCGSAFLIAATAGTASAARDVTMQYQSAGGGAVVQWTLGDTTRDGFVGQLRHKYSNDANGQFDGVFATYCSEPLERVNGGENASKLAVVGSADGIDAPRAAVIHDLYALFGSQATDFSAGSTIGAAFQLTVWEIITDFQAGDYSSLDRDAGDFSVRGAGGGALDGAIAAQVDAMFASLENNQGAGAGLTVFNTLSPSTQNQLVIPTPGAAALAVLGFGAAAARRRRR